MGWTPPCGARPPRTLELLDLDVNFGADQGAWRVQWPARRACCGPSPRLPAAGGPTPRARSPLGTMGVCCRPAARSHPARACCRQRAGHAVWIVKLAPLGRTLCMAAAGPCAVRRACVRCGLMAQSLTLFSACLLAPCTCSTKTKYNHTLLSRMRMMHTHAFVCTLLLLRACTRPRVLRCA